MLIEFKVKNYKSLYDETVFTMIPAPKQKGLDFSIREEKIGGKQVKALSSSVIYGPNAAGKSNIIGAMDTFRSIILRGHIRNSEEKTSLNASANVLELIPNNKYTDETVLFSICFVHNKMKIEYLFDLELGNFLDAQYQRKVCKEELYINGEIIFTRDDNIVFGESNNFEKYGLPKVVDENLVDIARNSLNQEELFLMNGFKVIFSPLLVKDITYWIQEKFMVIYRADSMQFIGRFVDSKKQTVYVEETTNEAAKAFGINSNDLGYVTGSDENEVKLCSLFKNISNGKNVAINADMFESYGTVRFINIFPLVIKAIMTGSVLVVDEFDASIHPMALINIINIFHNDEINKKGAQLIFNTHNPIFLNSNILRRDEIKFMERSDEGNSSLYSLSDFGTSGKSGVRKSEDYMKNYFIYRYGGIKDVDFSAVFEKLLESQEDN